MIIPPFYKNSAVQQRVRGFIWFSIIGHAVTVVILSSPGNGPGARELDLDKSIVMTMRPSNGRRRLLPWGRGNAIGVRARFCCNPDGMARGGQCWWQGA